MKALVKCKFYFMTLFAAVLLTVGTVASDDQTDLSIGDATQMTQKPTIMILGSGTLGELEWMASISKWMMCLPLNANANFST